MYKLNGFALELLMVEAVTLGLIFSHPASLSAIIRTIGKDRSYLKKGRRFFFLIFIFDITHFICLSDVQDRMTNYKEPVTITLHQ